MKLFFLSLVILTSLIMMLSCSNVFAPDGDSSNVTEEEASKLSYDELMAAGASGLDRGEYENAYIYFKTAVDKKPESGVARLNTVTSIVLKSHIDIMWLSLNSISNFNEEDTAIEALSATFRQMIIENGDDKVVDLFRPEGIFFEIEHYLNDKNGYSMLKGETDSSVSSNSVLLHLNIVIIQPFIVIANLLDFDGDGNFGTSNDLFPAPEDSDDIVNMDVIDSKITSLTNILKDLETLLTDPSVSYSSLTNLYAISSNYHRYIELDLIPFIRLANNVFSTVYDITNSIELVKNGRLSDNDIYSPIIDALDDLEEIFDETNDFSGIVNDLSNVGNVGNATHKSLVGENAYLGYDINSFIETPWNTHTNSGGIKGTLESTIAALESISDIDLGGLEGLKDLSNAFSNPEDASNFINDFSNSISNFEDMTNIFSDYDFDSIDLGW